jgi:hypothetical protein
MIAHNPIIINKKIIGNNKSTIQHPHNNRNYKIKVNVKDMTTFLNHYLIDFDLKKI